MDSDAPEMAPFICYNSSCVDSISLRIGRHPIICIGDAEKRKNTSKIYLTYFRIQSTGHQFQTVSAINCTRQQTHEHRSKMQTITYR